MTLGRKLFGAAGRLRRRDYWLLSIGSAVVITVLDVIANIALGSSGSGFPDNPISIVLWLVSLWISIALMIKRLHDRAKGPVWIVVFMIPVIGWVWAFIELGLLDGTPGANRYGPSPKGAAPTQADVVETFSWSSTGLATSGRVVSFTSWQARLIP